MHQACQSARWIKTPNKSISYCFSGYRRVLETEEFSPKEQRVFFTGMRSDAIVHNAPKLAHDGAEKLDRSLEGHEWDFPHKNRSLVKAFHRLYVELGKRTEKLKSAIMASDLPRSAVAYGKILEVRAARLPQEVPGLKEAAEGVAKPERVPVTPPGGTRRSGTRFPTNPGTESTETRRSPRDRNVSPGPSRADPLPRDRTGRACRGAPS